MSGVGVGGGERVIPVVGNLVKYPETELEGIGLEKGLEDWGSSEEAIFVFLNLNLDDRVGVGGFSQTGIESSNFVSGVMGGVTDGVSGSCCGGRSTSKISDISGVPRLDPESLSPSSGTV